MGAEISKQRSEYEKFSAAEVLEQQQMQSAAALKSSREETTSYAASSTQRPGDSGSIDRKLEEKGKTNIIRQESKVSSIDSGISGLQINTAEEIIEGEDEVDGPESEAFKTLRKFLPKLIDAIVPDIETLAISFYSKYLINETTKDAVVNLQNGLVGVQKAIRVLQYVEHQVKGDETKLRQFIEVLKDSGSSTATDIGERMHLDLEQNSAVSGAHVVDVSTPLPSDFPPHLGFNSSSHHSTAVSRSNHPPVVTQSSAPASSEHRKKRLEFSERKYSSLPETESPVEVPPSRLFCRTSSTCSTGEEDLFEMTNNLACQLLTVSNRQKRRKLHTQSKIDLTQTELDDAKKKIEELTRKVESLEQRNKQLNSESVECKIKLERYKKSTTEASNGRLKQNGSSDCNTHLNFECMSCPQCKDKDKLIESERKKHKAIVENLEIQMQMLLGRLDTEN